MPELLSSVADLLWPIVVVVGFLLFSRPLAALLRSGRDRDEVKFEIGGQKVTFGKLREQQNEIVLDLQRQLAELRRQVGGGPTSEPAPARHDPSVLWVDDHPENNALIVDQLMTAGVTVALAVSTAQAMELTSLHSYDVVISDLGRKEGNRFRPRAGLELAQELRAANSRVPLVMFTSMRGAGSIREEAATIGVDEVTGSASDLTAFLRRHGVVD